MELDIRNLEILGRYVQKYSQAEYFEIGHGTSNKSMVMTQFSFPSKKKYINVLTC